MEAEADTREAFPSPVWRLFRPAMPDLGVECVLLAGDVLLLTVDASSSSCTKNPPDTRPELLTLLEGDGGFGEDDIGMRLRRTTPALPARGTLPRLRGGVGVAPPTRGIIECLRSPLTGFGRVRRDVGLRVRPPRVPTSLCMRFIGGFLTLPLPLLLLWLLDGRGRLSAEKSTDWLFGMAEMGESGGVVGLTLLSESALSLRSYITHMIESTESDSEDKSTLNVPGSEATSPCWSPCA